MHNVSIIMPVYKAEMYIKEAIESVISQTYHSWELILVNDCSPDNSTEIIKEYLKKDNRIHLVNLEQNMGAWNARNIGIKEAKGRFLAFLDSDDIWFDRKLELQMDFMRDKNAKLSFTSYTRINEDGDSLGQIVTAIPELSYSKYLLNTPICFSSVIIDKMSIEVPTFIKLKLHEDMVFLSHIFEQGVTAHGLSKVLLKYRVLPNSLSSNKINAAIQYWRNVRNILGFNTIKSLYFFFGYSLNAVLRRIL